MAYVPMEKLDGGQYLVKCLECGGDCGVIDHTEVASYLMFVSKHAQYPFCFDCDTFVPDEVPPILDPWNGQGGVVIGATGKG